MTFIRDAAVAYRTVYRISAWASLLLPSFRMSQGLEKKNLGTMERYRVV